MQALQVLQDLGLYPSRSEAIRAAIRDFLQKELGFSQVFDDIEARVISEKLHASLDVEEKKKEISRLLRKLKSEHEPVEAKTETEIIWS